MEKWYLEGYTGGWTASTTLQNEPFSFNFTGTQFRIIGYIGGNRSKNICITIDGISYYYSQFHGTGTFKALIFDSINSVTLNNGTHYVTIVNQADGALEVDAVDIPSTDTINNPNEPIPTPTPTPTPSPELCSNTEIMGSLGFSNPGNISPNSQIKETYTVTGAQLGDIVQVSFDQDLQGVMLFGYVSAQDKVTVVFQNSTGNTVALTSGTIRVHISRHSKLQ